jgi:hypothetical protein
LKKDFFDYGLEQLEEVFNKVFRRVDEGKRPTEIIPYVLSILRKEYKKVS